MTIKPLTVDTFSKLTSHLFAAALAPERWPEFLAELSRAHGDIAVHIFGYDNRTETSFNLLAHGYDPAYIESYNAYYGGRNAWAPGFSVFDAGVTIDCELMCPTPQLQKTEFYNDWVLPQENVCQGGGALAFKEEDRMVAFGGNIRAKDEERLKANWLHSVGQLIPHIQQALEINRMMIGGSIAAAAAPRESLEMLTGVVVVSRSGHIDFADKTAQRMLARGIPVMANRNGSITLADRAGRLKLTQFLQGFTTLSAPSITIDVPGETSQDHYIIRCARLDASEFDLSPYLWMLSPSAQSFLLLISNARQADDAAGTMFQRHGVTPAEIAVALALADGLDIRSIAEERAVSVQTVRNQLKSAMGKLGVSRQAELVATVLRAMR